MTNQEKTKEALAKIENALQNINTDADWLQYLAFQAKFYRYSARNVLLIRAQNPEARYVKGYKTWRELDRFVKKGAKGIAILAPCIKYDGPCVFRTVHFCLTLEQAKERITNFNGEIKGCPDFYAYIRVFDGEPAYCGQAQLLYLEEFARRYGITYKEKFVCVGGQREDALEFTSDGPHMYAGIYDILRPSWFSFLVVSDTSRLSDCMRLWEQKFEIISLNMEDFGYTEYWYREPGKPRKKVETHKSSMKDMEYEIMSQEYRKMMLEQDEPFIEAEEEYD